MSDVRLCVRLHDRPQALERALGLIRRRALPVRLHSVMESNGAVIELRLRVVADDAAERVRVDLLELYDVIDVEFVAASAALSHESSFDTRSES